MTNPRSYAMLVYQPPGLKPRRFLFYDAFPVDSGLLEFVGKKGLPKVMAERHKRLISTTPTRKVTHVTYATHAELSDFISLVPEERPGLGHLMKDIIDSANSLAMVGMTNIYLILWKAQNVKHRQKQVL